ncbi:hypothetical protein CPB83DRAFT_863841 [Crepidotus variabilis]|uniref:Ubiquitin carboxyl-terminal hydrolase n=1 Tax=Crepidotus variabilis TaxID=179855 RepID=A0A9P6JJ41_9AGAR|nr:hypothetical protein CPB83DRAFT_863841 [Crepidotus variabilis]
MSEGALGRWIPLESNPDVFNSWAQKVGVLTKRAYFVDIYALDEEMLAIVPKPVKAVILLFPIEETGEAERKVEDERIKSEGNAKIDDTIFWVKQTISNACGTIGLIHALANSGISFGPTSSLQKFIMECQDKTPEERAKLLSTTPLFANIHAESANQGQTAPHADTDLHFTCFVEAPEQDFRKIAREGQGEESGTESTGMRLIELDGRRNGPIDRGECNDLLQDAAKFVKTRYMSKNTSVMFNLMALTTATPEE